MTGVLPSSIVAGISFIGRSGGQVKALGGFKKGHHTLPDAANTATQAFLGKICAGELAEEAEKLFQAVRAGLSYRRKDLSLQISSPGAVLTTKDFVVEFLYALEESAPARYAATTTLHSVKNPELPWTEEFDRIFSARFTELSFAFRQSVSVEATIDLIESLDESALKVTYPSDCRECRISVTGVPTEVRCGGGSLEMIFPRAGSPRELLEEFAQVREAFAVNRELAGMLG